MERMRNEYGDKMRHLNEFFSPHFYVSVFWIYVSCNGMQRHINYSVSPKKYPYNNRINTFYRGYFLGDTL